jgi:hypothetical protein
MIFRSRNLMVSLPSGSSYPPEDHRKDDSKFSDECECKISCRPSDPVICPGHTCKSGTQRHPEDHPGDHRCWVTHEHSELCLTQCKPSVKGVCVGPQGHEGESWETSHALEALRRQLRASLSAQT